eukprot:g3783.t1
MVYVVRAKDGAIAGKCPLYNAHRWVALAICGARKLAAVATAFNRVEVISFDADKIGPMRSLVLDNPAVSLQWDIQPTDSKDDEEERVHAAKVLAAVQRAATNTRAIAAAGAPASDVAKSLFEAAERILARPSEGNVTAMVWTGGTHAAVVTSDPRTGLMLQGDWSSVNDAPRPPRYLVTDLSGSNRNVIYVWDWETGWLRRVHTPPFSAAPDLVGGVSPSSDFDFRLLAVAGSGAVACGGGRAGRDGEGVTHVWIPGSSGDL